jgi:hypothetical protein
MSLWQLIRGFDKGSGQPGCSKGSPADFFIFCSEKKLWGLWFCLINKYNFAAT